MGISPYQQTAMLRTLYRLESDLLRAKQSKASKRMILTMQRALHRKWMKAYDYGLTEELLSTHGEGLWLEAAAVDLCTEYRVDCPQHLAYVSESDVDDLEDDKPCKDGEWNECGPFCPHKKKGSSN